MIDIGVSPLTCKIFVGKCKKLPNMPSQWIGKPKDITDAAIKAVFEHMWFEAEETGHYNITIEGYGVMSFTREGKTNDE